MDRGQAYMAGNRPRTNAARLLAIAAALVSIWTVGTASAQGCCGTVYDPTNYGANNGTYGQMVSEVALSQSRNGLLDQMAKAMGLPGEMNGLGDIGGLASSFLGGRSGFGFSGYNSGQALDFGTIGGAPWSYGNSSNWALGQAANQFGLDSSDPKVQAGLAVAAALLGRGLGQSATMGRSLVPTYQYYGASAPADIFTTVPSSVAWSRQMLERPAGQVSVQELELRDRRRSREVEEAALDLHGLANHALRATSDTPERVKAFDKALKSGGDQRVQLATLGAELSAILEELSGIRSLMAGEARLMAAEKLSLIPVGNLRPGTTAIPGTTVMSQVSN